MSLDFNLKNLNEQEFVESVNKFGESNYISKSGVYPVKISYVRIWENKTGSKSFSIVCSLEGKKEETIVYGSVFQKADGSKCEVGFNKIVSLQVACGINNLTEVTKKVKSFKDANEILELQVFKEFEDKKVILQVVREYSQYDGKIRSAINFRDAFRVNDNASAAEIISKSNFGSKMKWIEANPDKVSASSYRDVTEDEVKAWLDSQKKNSKKADTISVVEDDGELPF